MDTVSLLHVYAFGEKRIRTGLMFTHTKRLTSAGSKDPNDRVLRTIQVVVIAFSIADRRAF
jgi:hypothetical protein